MRNTLEVILYNARSDQGLVTQLIIINNRNAIMQDNLTELGFINK